MHRILERQIKQSFGEHATIPAEWTTFLQLVSDTYTHLDEDRTLLNRSLELSSKEFLENNRLLKESQVKVEKQAKNLTTEVTLRTKELNKQVAELENTRSAMANLLEDFEIQQKVLVETKAHDDALLSSIGDGLMAADKNGKIILMNKIAEKYLEMKSTETLNTLFVKTVRLEDFKGNPISDDERLVAKILSTNTPTTANEDFLLVRKNGTKLPVNITVSPIVIEGRLIGAIQIFRDITSHLREEERLKADTLKKESLAKDLEKFKLAVDNVTDTIVISDPEGIVIYANKAVEKVTGYKNEDVIGKKSGSLWKSPMPKEYYQKLWDTIKIQKKTFTGEIHNKRKSGEIYPALISISPILNKNDDIEFFVGIERDISHEKEIDRLKDEFVSIASHELRTPLTAIDGLVSMILDGEYGPITQDITQPLTDINTSTERLIHLVNDLLNLSRIKAGRMKYTLSEFSVSTVITETVKLLAPLAQRKGLQLTAEKLEPVTVQGDMEKIKEILNNLIGNSLKFTDQGTITVSTKKVADMLEIDITDTGIGIAKQDQQKLFGLFQQLESGIGRPAGTGLGLHISRELVVKMGGTLWLEKSEVGKGSTFAFTIPLVKSLLATVTKTEIDKETKEHPDQKADTMVRTIYYGASR